MLVLDTHVLVWWVSNDEKLSKNANNAIEMALSNGDELLVSAITSWELAMLVSKGRLTLTMDIDSWLQMVNTIPQLRFISVDNKVAVESTRLPGEFHKDPADRMIVALARVLSAPLITADEKIRNYQHVKSIW